MTSASVIASTACTVASPGCPGPTPTSLTLPMPPPMALDRLELSGNHVVRQRRQRADRLWMTQRAQPAARFGCVLAGSFERALRTAAAAHDLHHVLRVLGRQLHSIAKHWLEPLRHRRLL